MVAVEVPSRCEKEVAAAHAHRVAVDDRPDALALDDETEGVLRVAVFRRGLLGTEILDRTPQCRGNVGAATETGICQADRAPLAAAPDGHEVARPLSKRIQVRPLPDVRYRFGRRVHRHEVVDLRPQRHEVLFLEALVESAKLRRVLGMHRVVDRVVVHDLESGNRIDLSHL